MTEYVAQFSFALIFFIFGYLVATMDKKEKKHRMWYVEKFDEAWKFWDEDKNFFVILLTAIRLRKNGYKSRIGRYKFYN